MIRKNLEFKNCDCLLSKFLFTWLYTALALCTFGYNFNGHCLLPSWWWREGNDIEYLRKGLWKYDYVFWALTIPDAVLNSRHIFSHLSLNLTLQGKCYYWTIFRRWKQYSETLSDFSKCQDKVTYFKEHAFDFKRLVSYFCYNRLPQS